MPVLQSGVSLPIPVVAGQTLVLKELTGTASVTGGTATREDATTRIGAGFYVYGPQAAAGTITLSTTGLVEWQVVNGDATPANQPVLFDPGNPGTSGPSLSGDAAGAVLGVAAVSTRRAVILGDSRTQQNYDQTATAITGRVRWWTVMQAKSGQPFELINNAGVNGQTVAQMSARLAGSALGAGFGAVGDAATAVTTSPGVLGVAGVTDVFVCAGYNDIMGSGATAADTYASAVAGLLNPIRRAGMKLWLGTCEHANSAAAGYTSARAAQLYLYNTMLRSYAAANPGVELIDFEAAMLVGAATSSSIESAAVDMRDGTVHENDRGGWRKGSAAAAVVALRLPPRSGILPVSNAATTALSGVLPVLTPNPFLVGTSAISTTGFTGSAAGSGLNNSNFVRSGSATCTLSAVARSDGSGGQNTKMACTFTAAAETIEHRGNSVHAQAVVGGKYFAVCEVSFTGPSGAALTAADNLRGVQLYLQYNDGTTNFFSYDWATTTTDSALFESSGRLVLKTPLLTIPASGTPTTFRANITATGNGAGSSEITFGLPAIMGPY